MTETDFSPAIILCEPQMGENIGTAARAMANFGLKDLRLVNPRDGWPNERAVATASRADHVINAVRVFETLEEAIADLKYVYATTARDRDLTKLVRGPEEAARAIRSLSAMGGRTGILFGRERWGLNNEEISRADEIITLPVDPTYASLNIAQAVLIIAYEWRKHGFASETESLPWLMPERSPLAEKAAVTHMFAHLETALEERGFFRPPEKKAGMVNNLRAIFMKAHLTDQEVRTLRGAISALELRHLMPRGERPRIMVDKTSEGSGEDDGSGL